MKLKVKPVTCFEMKGVFLVTLFPSIFKGFTAVLCGEEKGTRHAKVIHDCILCKAYGHKNCPYVKEGIKYYNWHTGDNLSTTEYSILQKEVKIDPRWTQIPIPTGKGQGVGESEPRWSARYTGSGIPEQADRQPKDGTEKGSPVQMPLLQRR